MSYPETLDYLFSRLPMFSRIGAAAIKPDLTNTRLLCEALGNPHEGLRAIHIAGTNGKGSVSHMLAAIFQQHGFKTGLYTSPHLVDFRERIRINGQPVSEAWVVDFVAGLKEAIEATQPSFFEITVAMAFAYFAEQQVDMAIIETGLGGRLDSTNIITPELSVITNISYDHTDLLGDTLEKIAGEKAGIIKPGVPVVIGEEHPETAPVFFRKSVEQGAPLLYAEGMLEVVKTGHDNTQDHYKAVFPEQGRMIPFSADLTGAYQPQNLRAAWAAATVARDVAGWPLEDQKTAAALGNVKAATGLRGRWDVWQTAPLVVADVAHNAAGLQAVLRQFAAVQAAQKHIVLGFVRDKDVDAALRLFPKDARYYFTNAAIPRALPAAELSEKAGQVGLDGAAFGTVAEALNTALTAASEGDAVLVTGSFFVVGEAMERSVKL